MHPHFIARRVLSILFAAIAIIVAPARAGEPARLALLIGNGAYTAKVGPLNNPVNDVSLVGGALQDLGFKVTVVRDADYKTMDTAIKRYVAEVHNAGPDAISFFYYSGHGVANPETQINYLIPVDLADPADSNIWYQSFQQNDLIEKLSRQAANATHYVVFDACRNELNLASRASKGLGADEKGFVPVQQTTGILIAYATAPNKTASDVGEGGGPYAKALAEELIKPGVEAVTMFRNVQIRVKASIGQDPWLTFPSLPSVYLAGKADAGGAEVAKLETGKPGAGLSPRGMNSADLVPLLQFHLKRVGCDPGDSNGKWSADTRRAMEAFNKQTGRTLDVTVASLEALEVVRGTASRVCPLTCRSGFRLDGDHCVAIERAPKAVERRAQRPDAAPRAGGKCFSFNGKQFCE